MSSHRIDPFLGQLAIGADHRIFLDVQDQDGNDRDYTGASGTVSFDSTIGDQSIVLHATPDSAPQAYFDIPDTETAGASSGTRVRFTATITLADAKKDVLYGRFELL